MTDDLKYDNLSATIDDVIRQGEAASTGNEELDALARLAAGLRGLPGADFRARLRTEMATRSGGIREPLPGASWVRRQALFLLGGSSFGVVAGTCCLIGATAYVTGLYSADAITSFIDSTLPYFIALSVVSMIGWLAWLLREQGLTPVTVGRMVRQHGVALGGSYGAVFGASMLLSMSMGLL